MPSPSQNGGPHARPSSPVSGRSTLTTSAPSAARIWAQYGPAIDVVTSSTRVPWSGLCTARIIASATMRPHVRPIRRLGVRLQLELRGDLRRLGDRRVLPHRAERDRGHHRRRRRQHRRALAPARDPLRERGRVRRGQHLLRARLAGSASAPSSGVFKGEKSRKAFLWAEEQLETRGFYLIIIARFIPGGRTAVTFSSGYTHGMTYRRFVIADVVAALIWGTLRRAARLHRRQAVRGGAVEGPPPRLRRRGLGRRSRRARPPPAGAAEASGRRRDGARRRRSVLGQPAARAPPPSPSARLPRSKHHAPTSRMTSASKPCRPLTQPPGSSVSPRNASCATAEDEKCDGEPDRAPVAPPRPDRADHDQELPDVDDHREAAVGVERALARATHVRGDRERLDQHADDGDRAAGEHEPHRCSSHARDHTTSLRSERSVARRGKNTGMNRLARVLEPVPPPARRQPGRLVPVGRRGIRARARRGPAAARLRRLQLVPLVPRDGARVVLRPDNRVGDERPLREREGRPRGAPRRRRADDGRVRDDDRPGRLADDGVPDARRAAVLRGHVLPARAAPRDPELPAAPPGDRGARGASGATISRRRRRSSSTRSAARPG